MKSESFNSKRSRALLFKAMIPLLTAIAVSSVVLTIKPWRSEKPAQQIEIEEGFTLSRLRKREREVRISVRQTIESKTEIISQTPQEPYPYIERGRVYREAKLYDNALKDLEMAISLKPDLIDSYIERADIFIDMNRIDDASSDIGRVDDRASSVQQVEYLKCRYFAGIEEYPTALNHCHQAVSLNPLDHAVLNQRGLIFKALRNFKEAIHDFRAAIEKRDSHPDYRVNLGKIYLELQQPKQARHWFETAREEDPFLLAVHKGLGHAAFMLNEYDKAVEHFSNALLINPDDMESYSSRGLAYRELGEYSRSVDDLNTVLLFQPGDLDTVPFIDKR